MTLTEDLRLAKEELLTRLHFATRIWPEEEVTVILAFVGLMAVFIGDDASKLIGPFTDPEASKDVLLGMAQGIVERITEEMEEENG